MSRERLAEMYAYADPVDQHEGRLAYLRYHEVMRSLSARYEVSLPRTVAAFASLSPNSDYYGNLRSTVSVLEAVQRGWPIESVVVSTYNHCKLRAYAYATGAAEFESATRGLKILNFYRNLLHPDDPTAVTVDGHVCATWRGQALTMKQAIIRNRNEYLTIQAAVVSLALEAGLVPCQYQATIWFARKRRFQSKYSAQRSLFAAADDAWATVQDVGTLLPYPRRTGDFDAQPRPPERNGRPGQPEQSQLW